MKAIGAILHTVHRKSGVDFSSYRVPTVERRIRNRMISLGVTDLAEYRQLLEDSADEAQRLIERITIKVSRFYRNADVFDVLRCAVLPEVGQSGRPVRIWSAGCGRGEEPYTLAMLLEEGGLAGTVTATDIDPLALASASQGNYPCEAAAELPPALRRRFLHPVAHGAASPLGVCAAVRSRVSFELADLTASSAAGHGAYDLICCRNVLIYWNADRQAQILRALIANLRTGGFICLGEAEWPAACFGELLQPLGRRLRLFRKIAEGTRP